MKAKLKPLIVFYVAAFVVQTVGNYFTMMSVKSWYLTLEKSILTPPGYVFGIVWTALYILMSIAAWRVHQKEQQGYFSPALKLWWLQLVLGLLWSAVFFGLREVDGGMAVILLVWLAIVATLARFICVERIAGYLLVPLGLWASFATYLNAVIALKN
jgi:translocator protein